MFTAKHPTSHTLHSATRHAGIRGSGMMLPWILLSIDVHSPFHTHGRLNIIKYHSSSLFHKTLCQIGPPTWVLSLHHSQVCMTTAGMTEPGVDPT